MGGVYWTNPDIIATLILPIAGVYMAAVLLYHLFKKYYAKLEEINYKSELSK